MNRIHIWVGVGTLAVLLAAVLTRVAVLRESRQAAVEAEPAFDEVVFEQGVSNRVAAGSTTSVPVVHRQPRRLPAENAAISRTDEPAPSTASTGPTLAGIADNREALPGREASAPFPVATVLLGSGTRRFVAKPGGSLKIHGQSTLGEWSAESSIVGGYLKVSSQALTVADAGDDSDLVDVEAVLSVPVRGLKSGMDALDRGLQEAMQAEEHPTIKFTLDELRWLESPEADPSLGRFQAKGVLMAAGVEIEREAQVQVETQEGVELTLSTRFDLRMSDFGIDPAKLAVPAGTSISVDDQVSVELVWLVATRL